jgi:YesN/AraC family two-component response regulator
MATTVIYIKNMVCPRCVMAVKGILAGLCHDVIDVTLGKAVLLGELTEAQKVQLKHEMELVGFELLDDKNLQLIESIKRVVIKSVHYDNNESPVNISSLLSNELHMDYSKISKLFSEYAGMTIENFVILQKVERIKELITYNELSLSEIAYKMHYSSVAYLSSQFKKVTGLSPTQFREQHQIKRNPIDKI